jgi:DNA-binding MarR family transcriptional regulator
VSAEEWDVWRSFTTMRNNLDRTLEKQLQASGEISAPDYEVLIALFEASDKRMRARELGARIGWEKSRLSHQVSRMEKRGLLERTECDTDLRGTWIGLTPSGSRAILSAMRGHNALIRQYFFDVLSDDEKSALLVASRRVLDTIDPPTCDTEGAEDPDD